MATRTHTVEFQFWWRLLNVTLREMSHDLAPFTVAERLYRVGHSADNAAALIAVARAQT